MPIKKYFKERTLYKRVEKVSSSPSPPPSTSTTSLQSLNKLSTGPSSVRSSPGRSYTTEHQFLDDEYNPYSYGLVPLSESNIYREYQVIEPPKDMVWKEDIVQHRMESNSGIPASSNGTTSRRGTSVERIIKPILTEEILLSKDNTSTSCNSRSTTSRPKTVRIVECPQKWSSSSRHASSRKSTPSPSSSFSSYPSSSSSSKRDSQTGVSHFDSEPVPTTFSSYKCTKYTLNEIRSF